MTLPRRPLIVALWGAVLLPALPAIADSQLTVGPRAVQNLVATQLFAHAGRWYLIDDGGCHTYLESPRTQLQNDRLVLHAHLTSRLGQDVGGSCVGADLASNVTLSGRLRGGGHTLVLEDIRIDRIDDDTTRSALALALQVDPTLLPRSAALDVSAFVRRDVLPAGDSPARMEDFQVLGITTRPDAVSIHFDVRLSAP